MLREERGRRWEAGGKRGVAGGMGGVWGMSGLFRVAPSRSRRMSGAGIARGA